MPRIRNREKELANRRAKVADGFCGYCSKERTHYAYLCDDCEEKHRQKQRRAYVPSTRVVQTEEERKRRRAACGKARRERYKAQGLCQCGRPKDQLFACSICVERRQKRRKLKALAERAVVLGDLATPEELEALIQLRIKSMPDSVGEHV